MRVNRAFDRRATWTYVWSFRGATMGQIFIILSWREFGPLRQCCRKFPSRIFYPFWPPYHQKLRFGLFDRRAIKIYVFGLFDCCAAGNGLKKPRLMEGLVGNFVEDFLATSVTTCWQHWWRLVGNVVHDSLTTLLSTTWQLCWLFEGDLLAAPFMIRCRLCLRSVSNFDCDSLPTLLATGVTFWLGCG